MRKTDPIGARIATMSARVQHVREAESYFYNRPLSPLGDGIRVVIDGREMMNFASYSYLGLMGHARINAAAREAVEEYSTGTHGVRTLAGTLPIHDELERTIAAFKRTEAAITFSSGYATNLAVIASLVGRGDYVFSDRSNHASIVDGCQLSGARCVRYRHGDVAALAERLEQAPAGAGKLIVADAVFSMDGDILDLPAVIELARRHDAWVMVDEAHSLGVLGKHGRGIDEHFGIEGEIDIKMGTLSKAIPSVGGYVAGSDELISYLRHASRAYLFSAALPPAQAAAAREAFGVIVEEPWRVERLRTHASAFIEGVRSCGFDTLCSTTAIVPSSASSLAAWIGA